VREDPLPITVLEECFFAGSPKRKIREYPTHIQRENDFFYSKETTKRERTPFEIPICMGQEKTSKRNSPPPTTWLQHL
jgi:hypothetical protein